MTYLPTRPEPNIWQQSRPSPVADLIQRHRAEMAQILQRHEAELRKLVGERAA